MKKTGIAMVLLGIVAMSATILLAPAAQTHANMLSTSSNENVGAAAYASTDVHNVAATAYEPSRN
jgi:hypothetical protein